MSAGANVGVRTIGSVWHLKHFFSKFLLDGVSEDVVGDSCWRKQSRVSIKEEGVKEYIQEELCYLVSCIL